MTRGRTFRIALLIIGLLLVAGVGWWAFVLLRPPPFKLVLRGSRGTSGQLGVSGGNLVVAPPGPGVYFGTVRKPGSPEEFTYLILFRYGRTGSNGSSRGITANNTSDGRTAETKDAIDLDGKRVEANYRIELDESLKGVANETLTIGGKPVDMAAGRVFLIDLTADAPSYRQKAADLPAIPAKLETPEDVERLADAIRKSLESQDADLKSFLR